MEMFRNLNPSRQNMDGSLNVFLSNNMFWFECYGILRRSLLWINVGLAFCVFGIKPLQNQWWVTSLSYIGII